MKLPKFANESEEAQWWFENQDLLEAEFVKAAAEGRLRQGTVARLAAKKREEAKTADEPSAQSTSLSVLH